MTDIIRFIKGYRFPPMAMTSLGVPIPLDLARLTHIYRKANIENPIPIKHLVDVIYFRALRGSITDNQLSLYYNYILISMALVRMINEDDIYYDEELITRLREYNYDQIEGEEWPNALQVVNLFIQRYNRDAYKTEENRQLYFETFADNKIIFATEFNRDYNRNTNNALVALFVLSLPIQRGLLDFLIDNNVRLFFSIMLSRLNIKYKTKDVIALKSGGSTVNTFVKDNYPFSLSIDASQMIRVNYNYLAGVLVKNDDNVITIPSAFCEEYKGGKSTKFHDTETYKNSFGESDGSLLVFIVPEVSDVKEYAKHSYIDFSDTGYFCSRDKKIEKLKIPNETYQTLQLNNYQDRYGFRATLQRYLSDLELQKQYGGVPNYVSFLGSYFIRNTDNSIIPITGRGHAKNSDHSGKASEKSGDINITFKNERL
jgi:hypothetical protein